MPPGLGQSVVVENRGGGNGSIAADTVAKSTPDGYTLLIYSSIVWTLQFMQTVPYDPVRDFAPVTMAAIAPNILVVHPALPVNSVKELIALAKARPGELNYATGGSGSQGHLSAELFKTMAHLNMVRIPYKGSGPALNALMSGQVQLMFVAAGGVLPHVRSGRLKALAVTTARPSAMAPGLPTVASAGLAGYDSNSSYAVLAPSGTPVPVIARLNQEMVRVLKQPETKERLFAAGMEPVGSTPAELAATIKSDMTVLGKLIREQGIRAD
jgi:tripartite-type tricarboxylate transporter receptor subunit TctC